jgi:type I restriction enzyme, S subunit
MLSRENLAILPPGWRRVKLGEVSEINPRRPSGFKRPDTAPTTFVPMAAVEAIRGVIADPQIRPYAEVANGYTYFGEGDVLFAKITPCMQNGKHAVAEDLIDGVGFASTEFHVIRPGPDIDARWIHAFLRQPSVLSEATNYFTGAVGQQRVPDEFLRKLEIPLAPLADQRRITGVLHEQMAAVERARTAAEGRREAAEALPAAYLHQIFNASEARAWPKKALGNLLVAPLKTGISKPGSSESDICCLTLSAVRSGELDLSAKKKVKVSDEETGRNWVQPGGFYVVRGNGNRGLVGRGAFAPAEIALPVLYPDLLIQVLLYPEKVDPCFMRWVWDSREVRADIEGRARTAAGIYKINQKNLVAIKIPLPDLATQRRVASMLATRINACMTAEKNIRKELSAIRALAGALLRQAFNGEL